MKSVRGLKGRETMPGYVRDAAREKGRDCFLRWIHPSYPEAKPENISFEEFEVMIRRAVCSLQEAGLGAGDRMLLLAENSPAWQVMALAAQALRVEVAALFVSIGSLDAVDIACRVLPKVVVVSNATQWSKLEQVLKSLNCCAKVFYLDPSLDLKIPDRFPSLSFHEVQKTPPLSRESWDKLVDQVEPEDPFVMIFTSGTTGRQKGVRIPQRAAVSAFKGGIECTGLKKGELGLHILPFGHIAGLGAFYTALMTRSCLILCSRREDLQRGFSLHPTYTLLVPLLYERIWKEVLRKIEQRPRPLSRFLNRLLRISVREINGQPQGLWDRGWKTLAKILIGNPLKSKLGGKARLLAAGGAHSDREMVAFYRGLGFTYLNLYGMSETSGVIALNWADDPHIRLDSVGRPWKDVDLKIGEDGEILVRGATMMTGYLEKEANLEAYTEDGYFRTGDIGWMDAEGYLYITGRKKNTFVLSTGKKVSPEMIELKLREILPMINDAVLVGDQEAFVSAGLFVSKPVLEDLVARWGENGTKTFLLNQIRQGFAGISDYETPKQVFLIEGAPYDYPKMITPTLKIKRNIFGKLFSPQIAQIYRYSEKPRPMMAVVS